MTLSVRTRLAFSFAFIFTALLILFSGVVYYLMSSGLERELVEDTMHDVSEVLRVYTSGTWESQLAEMAEESREFDLRIRVLDPQGRVLFLTEGTTNEDWPVEPDQLRQALTEPMWSNEDIREVPHLILSQPIFLKNKPPHILQVANSRADIDRIRNQLIFCINVGTPLILLIAIFTGRFFAKKALYPVDQALLQMKRFIADASHELRIPLTGLRGTVEVALRQERTKEEYKQALETVHLESERMSELVWDLLSLARADAGQMKLEKSKVDIPAFMKDLFEEAEALNVEKRVAVRLDGIPNGSAVFDEAKVHQLLINLIENAIRYNNPAGEVILSARLDHMSFTVTVKDTGIGIASADQDKIFDRFYRVDKARAREAGGTGLGLSIARSIAQAHGGSLQVQSALGKGSEFTLTLPLT